MLVRSPRLCCFSPEGDVYKAQAPHLETRGAPEVPEEQDEQVEVPGGQVGDARRTTMPAAVLLLPSVPAGLWPHRPPRPPAPRPLEGSASPPGGCGLSFISRVTHFPTARLLLTLSATRTLLNTGHSSRWRSVIICGVVA